MFSCFNRRGRRAFRARSFAVLSGRGAPVVGLLACALAGFATLAWLRRRSPANEHRGRRDVIAGAQAKRGQALYWSGARHVTARRRSDTAPPLVGNDFMGDWSSQTLADLADKIKNTMPADDPGKLTPAPVGRHRHLHTAGRQVSRGGRAELRRGRGHAEAITFHRRRPRPDAERRRRGAGDVVPSVWQHERRDARHPVSLVEHHLRRADEKIPPEGGRDLDVRFDDRRPACGCVSGMDARRYCRGGWSSPHRCC